MLKVLIRENPVCSGKLNKSYRIVWKDQEAIVNVCNKNAPFKCSFVGFQVFEKWQNDTTKYLTKAYKQSMVHQLNKM